MGEGRGSRRRWTEEEKRQIVAQTRLPGMTVAEVARRYEVNTSLVFSWRRDPRLGAEAAPEARPSFVAVEVMAGAMSEGPETVVEVALRNGHRVTSSAWAKTSPRSSSTSRHVSSCGAWSGHA